MRQECVSCHKKTVQRIADKFNLDKHESKAFFLKAEHILLNYQQESNPVVATHIHRVAKQFILTSDIYAEEKEQANAILMASYSKWKKLVLNSNDHFALAAKLAVIGNIIDYGAHSAPDDIEQFIEEKINGGFEIDHSKLLYDAINKANKVLYLGDNAGEIVFDRIFIETINHPDLTFVVRGKPILNDITMHDAHRVGISNICKVIDNGNDVPSTILELSSPKFVDEFNQADLIISKGQGNYEGLIDNKSSKLFFLLMTKCDVVADLLHTKKGALVIKQNNG